jgi:predicted Ser/Thr protein kinase
MPLQPGDKLGPYEIQAPLGAGGMGEVYRARDTRLNRDVAIKISQERFSDRFEREARAVAALNHPNICHLYDVGPNYLVMELVEGESPKGPLPLEKALEYARQVADALEAAHEKAIVHRDLKPANIKITPDDKVKVLDFGLAKTSHDDAPPCSPEDSPTFTINVTQAGVILGTAAYMSPEQARGKSVDKRADIWAFGVVLYELLTGERPFRGEDLTEILASVVKESPDLSKAPAQVRRLIAKCLEKDPKKRLRDIGDAWELLEQPVAAAENVVVWPWVAAGVLGVALGIVGWMRPGAGAKDAMPLTFDIAPPPGVVLRNIGSNGSVPEISPDGSAVFYQAAARQLYVRRLDSLGSKVVPGSEGVSNPAFWSPDSTTIVYPVGSLRQLRKVRMPDGAPQTIAPLEHASLGGSWGDSGIILWPLPYLLHFVPAGGGEVKPVEMPGPLGGDARYPEFLAGSEDFLFLHGTPEDPADGSIYLATFSNGKAVNPSLLLRNATPARYTPAGGGRILFVRNDNLYSQKLNLGGRKLEGEAELVVQGVASGQRADVSVARNGTVVWRPGTAAYSRITEFDRGGSVIGTSGPKAMLASLTLSPDDKQLLAAGEPAALLVDIGQAGRIDLPKDVYWIGWIEGGSKLIGQRGQALVEMSAGGSGEVHEIRNLGTGFSPSNVSADGKILTGYGARGMSTARVNGTPDEVKPAAVDKSEGFSFPPRLSPDGRWILDSLDTLNGGGLYVQPFPGPGPRRQISATRGKAIWRGDGKEILYLEGDSVMSITVGGKGTLAFGPPHRLFSGLRTGYNPNNLMALAVSRDGSRIFYLQAVEQPEPNVIHVKIGAVK